MYVNLLHGVNVLLTPGIEFVGSIYLISTCRNKYFYILRQCTPINEYRYLALQWAATETSFGNYSLTLVGLHLKLEIFADKLTYSGKTMKYIFWIELLINFSSLTVSIIGKRQSANRLQMAAGDQSSLNAARQHAYVNTHTHTPVTLTMATYKGVSCNCSFLWSTVNPAKDIHKERMRMLCRTVTATGCNSSETSRPAD